MSYEQPPDRRTGASAAPPPGWYPDPGGLQAARWWNGTQWSPHTQPLPGIKQEPQPPSYPVVNASGSGGFDASQQESTGRHRQQSDLQDNAAAASFPTAQPDPFQPQQPQEGPDQHPNLAQQSYALGPQPDAHDMGDSGQRDVSGRVPLWRRPVVWVVAGVLGVAAIAGIVFAVTSGPGSFTAHGTEEVCVDAPDITDDTQVTVLDSAGHVLGTGSLAEDNSPEATKLITQYDALQVSLGSFGNSGPGMSIYTFTVTGLPGGQARYGIAVGQNRGTVYFTEQQMRSGPGVNLGC
jgi:hypothetical protein